MSKAKEIVELANRVVINELKPGDNVIMKGGHWDGKPGRIIDQNKDGSFNVRVASATLKEIPASMMVISDKP